MTHQVHAFEPPERFVAGTVGEPGDRTFYLQARGGGRVISVALEKVQVSLLAEKLEELLLEANKRFGVTLPEAALTVGHDNEPLDTPVDEEFRVGTLGLAFDVDTSTVVIEAIEAGEPDADLSGSPLDDEDDEEADDDEPDDDLDRLRVRLTPEATRAFIDRARRVVAAGRPPCPLCGQPLDPAGHLCPRHNGYHR
ncbi:putative repeat protein (TIGR03847 family) [Actinoplanes campanulatus]|uniref:Putative repeat protein (TIGR03847 family) n=1 Tax=Actinoplanes campanulatus TaxID=113559 RepID=A0A7W5AFA6_9ACTN|nr:DUF3090 domain-containing protein [Actinoplanes campanulatus]MBB3094965.1 putative repeat protein (TIGR03847 family) [Actinoplanes campanulatus]GGN08607.1 hypothetical protein GCM10010109_17540 [Actinoplanes campanulatus]GID36260.1 hypothetical protein Aca09nite_27660 [Actinoplanes campanulatus]